MATKKSAVAALTTIAYHPILVISAILAAVVPVQLLTDLVPSGTGWMIAIAGGALGVPLFVVVILDPHTRNAIDTVRVRLQQQWPSWTRREKLFASAYGDRAVLVLNRIIWVEALLSMFVDQAAFAVALAASA